MSSRKPGRKKAQNAIVETVREIAAAVEKRLSGAGGRLSGLLNTRTGADDAGGSQQESQQDPGHQHGHPTSAAPADSPPAHAPHTALDPHSHILAYSQPYSLRMDDLGLSLPNSLGKPAWAGLGALLALLLITSSVFTSRSARTEVGVLKSTIQLQNHALATLNTTQTSQQVHLAAILQQLQNLTTHQQQTHNSTSQQTLQQEVQTLATVVQGILSDVQALQAAGSGHQAPQSLSQDDSTHPAAEDSATQAVPLLLSHPCAGLPVPARLAYHTRTALDTTPLRRRHLLLHRLLRDPWGHGPPPPLPAAAAAYSMLPHALPSLSSYPHPCPLPLVTPSAHSPMSYTLQLLQPSVNLSHVCVQPQWVTHPATSHPAHQPTHQALAVNLTVSTCDDNTRSRPDCWVHLGHLDLVQGDESGGQGGHGGQEQGAWQWAVVPNPLRQQAIQAIRVDVVLGEVEHDMAEQQGSILCAPRVHLV